MSGETAGRYLIVEGQDDLRTFAEFFDQFVIWERAGKRRFADIKTLGTYSAPILERTLRGVLKASRVSHVGIVVDADQSAGRRWQSVINVLRKIGIGDQRAWAPEPAPDGFVLDRIPNPEIDPPDLRPLRLGVWLMPDNQNPGMLETFLGNLVSATARPLWSRADKWIAAVDIDRQDLAGVFKPGHLHKARFHAFLSVTDPPGKQLHEAIRDKVLQIQETTAQRLGAWFLQVFQPEEADRRTPAV